MDSIAPRRRCKLKLDLEADDVRELTVALENIARHIGMGELTSRGFSAGYNSSYEYELSEDESITHESWRAALSAAIARQKVSG